MEDYRRKLLKALTLCGSAAAVTKLPSTWTKPVVDAIALPAHAQLTGLCVITVEHTMELEGNWEGSGGFVVFNSTQCFNDSVGVLGPFDRSVSFNELGPGTYYFSGGGSFGGSAGAGSMFLRVACCDRDETVQVSDSGSGGNGGGVNARIIIRDDGTCDMNSNVSIPPFPCGV